MNESPAFDVTDTDQPTANTNAPRVTNAMHEPMHLADALRLAIELNEVTLQIVQESDEELRHRALKSIRRQIQKLRAAL